MLAYDQKVYKCLVCDKLIYRTTEPKICPKCGSKKIVFYDNYIIVK